MSQEIVNVFINEYDPMVHMAYQQKGSRLRGTVRTKTGVNAESVYFPRAGVGTAVKKARHGKIQPMSIDHDKVRCFIEAYYAGDWMDEADMVRTNINEKQVIAETAAAALGQNTDDLIITAADATTQIVTEAGNDGLTKAKFLEAMKTFGSNEAFEGDITCVVGPQQWNDLLNITEFANAYYVDSKPFPNMPYKQANWLGVNFIMSNRLKTDGNKRLCLMYNKTALGHAMNSDITTMAQFNAERDSYWVVSKNMEGACLIDERGVLKIECVEA